MKLNPVVVVSLSGHCTWCPTSHRIASSFPWLAAAGADRSMLLIIWQMICYELSDDIIISMPDRGDNESGVAVELHALNCAGHWVGLRG